MTDGLDYPSALTDLKGFMLTMASKEEVIKVANKLFVEKGFEKTTMEDIARALGVYKGSIYYYINNKADLFYEILVLTLDQSNRKLSKISKSRLPPGEKFEALLAAYFENILDNALEFQIIVNERRYMLSQKQERTVRKKMKTYEDYLVVALREGIEAKVFRDDLNPRVIVDGVISIGNGIYKWFSFDGPLTFNQIADMYVELVMTGLCKKRSKIMTEGGKD